MSRGRGGGRGGRGAMTTRSFNHDQLSAMGVANNEMLPTLVTQPPPLFPLMERRPVPLTQTLETDYLLILRQDFVDHMQLSASYLKVPETKMNQPLQEIDKLVAQLPRSKEKYDWSLFPAELRPKMLAKRVRKKLVVNKNVNVHERLQALEQLEESKEISQIKEEVEIAEDEETADQEEEQDEEMDDGTDYANNYFDNGEGYEDDDDNMDEGPIY